MGTAPKGWDSKRSAESLRPHEDFAIREYLIDWKSRHRAIVAFSGEHEYGGVKVTEARRNTSSLDMV